MRSMTEDSARRSSKSEDGPQQPKPNAPPLYPRRTPHLQYHKSMHYVYLIQSELNSERKYVGITQNLENRLTEHNQGEVTSTKKDRPWNLITYIAFSDIAKAKDFEKYLKSHSGRAFANKRLW